MKRITNALLAGLLLLCFTTSCSKDEDTDLRENLAGTYNYELKFYMEYEGSYIYMGSEYDQNGMILVQKNEENPDVIDFLEGGELLLQGSSLSSKGNSIVFDVIPQTITMEGESLEINGYEYWDVDGSKYHGAYITSSQTIRTAFSTEVAEDGMVFNLLFVVEGEKQ